MKIKQERLHASKHCIMRYEKIMTGVIEMVDTTNPTPFFFFPSL